MAKAYGQPPSRWLLPERTPEMSVRRADALRLRALDIDRLAFQLGIAAEDEARADVDEQGDLARSLREMD